METSERIEGPTPHGGVASIAYFQNKVGQPVEKSKATQVEIVEIDASGSSVHRSYMQIPKRD